MGSGSVVRGEYRFKIGLRVFGDGMKIVEMRGHADIEGWFKVGGLDGFKGGEVEGLGVPGTEERVGAGAGGEGGLGGGGVEGHGAMLLMGLVEGKGE